MLGCFLMQEGTTLCLAVGLYFGALGDAFVCMVVSSRGCNGLVFCFSCLFWGVAVSVNDCQKGGGWSVLWGVGEKCFPVFLETRLSLIFCELGFCCCVGWGCRAAGFVFCALTNRRLYLFRCRPLAHE